MFKEFHRLYGMSPTLGVPFLNSFAFQMEFSSSWEAFHLTGFPFSFPEHLIKGKPLPGAWGTDIG